MPGFTSGLVTVINKEGSVYRPLPMFWLVYAAHLRRGKLKSNELQAGLICSYALGHEPGVA